MKKVTAFFMIIIFIFPLTLTAFASSDGKSMGRVERILEEQEKGTGRVEKFFEEQEKRTGRVEKLLGVPEKEEVVSDKVSERKKSSAPTNINNTYKLSELGLQITIPSQYSVITRDTSANDPIFNALGTTRTDILSHFESNNIYLNAISTALNEEIVVAMDSNDFSDFSLISENSLMLFISGFVDKLTDYGVNVSSHEVYTHAQTKFIKVYFTDAAGSTHGLQYFTVCHGKALNFTMRSYTGSLSQRQENSIKAIVDSVTFDKTPPSPAIGEDTEAFAHTDTDTGVTFTVPANWERKEFFKDRKYIDVKFASTKEDGWVMIYGSYDLWAELLASEKIGYTRADANNSIFTKADIAEECGVTEDKVSTVTYNNTEYYKVEMETTSELYGLDFSVTITQLAHINNGWMYMFAFSGTSESEYYADFEKLLNSVQYPATSRASELSVSNDSSTILYMLFIVAIVIVLCVLIYKKVLRREKTCVSNATESNSTQWLTCENCGEILPKDSKFCYKCGLKTTKENGVL